MRSTFIQEIIGYGSDCRCLECFYLYGICHISSFLKLIPNCCTQCRILGRMTGGHMTYQPKTITIQLHVRGEYEKKKASTSISTSISKAFRHMDWAFKNHISTQRQCSRIRETHDNELEEQTNASFYIAYESIIRPYLKGCSLKDGWSIHDRCSFVGFFTIRILHFHIPRYWRESGTTGFVFS
jgi:hypothetical protein